MPNERKIKKDTKMHKYYFLGCVHRMGDIKTLFECFTMLKDISNERASFLSFTGEGLFFSAALP